MWIVFNDAFFSVVEDQVNHALLKVRARIPGDLERHFPDHRVMETEDSDYRFRVFVTRAEFKKVMGKAIDNIYYGNFKNSIEDEDRHFYYSRIWAVMHAWQEKIFPSDWWKHYLDKEK